MLSRHKASQSLSALLMGSLLVGTALLSSAPTEARSVRGVTPDPESNLVQLQAANKPALLEIPPREGGECETPTTPKIDLTCGSYAVSWRDVNGDRVRAQLYLSRSEPYMDVQFYNPLTQAMANVRQKLVVRGNRAIGYNPVDAYTGAPVSDYSSDVLEVNGYSIVARDSYGSYPVTLALY
ncbi:hypothetical protein [Synechococcus sp. PCC 7336]|uniref:hypothetical protein n=1 Tax=Synechococcus sp. PCC 7336 TaxID=195250 RepID=UPI00034DAAF4|nr:hypothetical protein [Synechococcus sp. PCC 7336]